MKEAGKDQNPLPLHLFGMKHSILWEVNTADKKSVKTPASVFGCKEISKNTSTSALLDTHEEYRWNKEM